MRRLNEFGIGAGLAMLLAVAPAAAQDATAAAGREVAQRWCVNCHVTEPNQTAGSDQAPSFRSIAERPGTTTASLHAFLGLPHGSMPDQALSNPDVDAVSAYILSLKR
jgi:mono/diheme cytochrome c family protein